MDKPMSNLGFWGMSVLFRIRDFLLPRRRLLNEAGISSGARVLDYGCGPGSYSIATRYQLSSRMVAWSGWVILPRT